MMMVRGFRSQLNVALQLSIVAMVSFVVAGQDLSEIPADLSFSCVGKAYGYYADVSVNCKVFHICLGDGDVKWSFLCPNQTSFNQQYFVCDYDSNVDCRSSETFYNLNENFGQQQPQQQSQRVVRQRPFFRVVDSVHAEADANADANADAEVEVEAADEARIVESRNDARDAANFIDVFEKVDDVVDVDNVNPDVNVGAEVNAGVDETTLESRIVESFDNVQVYE